MMMEWRVVAIMMMMVVAMGRSIERTNDHHVVAGMHVDGVDCHVDDDHDDDQDVEIAAEWCVEDDDVVVEDADPSGHDTLADTG